MPEIKGISDKKLAAMRKAGQIMAGLYRDLRKQVKPGVTEKELDAWVRKEIVKRGGTVAYDDLPKFGDPAFPGAICISTNDEIIHGAPSDYVLEEDDKVSFDLDIGYGGYYVDSAFTMTVGKKASSAVKNLIKANEEAMWAGIHKVKAGVDLGTVGHAIEEVLRKNKLGVIENYVGHGIGETMHEEPEVANYGVPGQGYVLKSGDVICIEPMASLGKPDNYISKADGWTVLLKDGSIGAHVEHTVLVKEDGYEVLTALKN